MGEKTNMNIWLAVLVYLASGIFIVYEKYRLYLQWTTDILIWFVAKSTRHLYSPHSID